MGLVLPNDKPVQKIVIFKKISDYDQVTGVEWTDQRIWVYAILIVMDDMGPVQMNAISEQKMRLDRRRVSVYVKLYGMGMIDRFMQGLSMHEVQDAMVAVLVHPLTSVKTEQKILIWIFQATVFASLLGQDSFATLKNPDRKNTKGCAIQSEKEDVQDRSVQTALNVQQMHLIMIFMDANELVSGSGMIDPFTWHTVIQYVPEVATVLQQANVKIVIFTQGETALEFESV